jgi:protein-L-isoaspartate(D-aspartate) O-methyltransferase
MTEEAARRRMVQEQLQQREVRDARVLDAMERVPRHLFVPEPLREHAYEDKPQPIGSEQTISQPLMVGLMTQLLELSGRESVLEVGTGSGYQTAILAELALRVTSIERHPTLAERASGLLEWLGYRNVVIHIGDGSLGHPSGAPFERILVTAAAPSIPAPLVDQLAPNGCLVIPVGTEEVQTLTVVRKDTGGHVSETTRGDCVFVPLIGAHGWSGPVAPG